MKSYVANTNHISKLSGLKYFGFGIGTRECIKRGGATGASEAVSVDLNGMLVRFGYVASTVSEAMSAGRSTEEV